MRAPPWRVDAAVAARLYREARAEVWGVTGERFASALDTSARKYFGEHGPAAHEIERYLQSLHLADLAVACACADGSEPAWDHFIREYRPVLYRAADALDAYLEVQRQATDLRIPVLNQNRVLYLVGYYNQATR